MSGNHHQQQQQQQQQSSPSEDFNQQARPYTIFEERRDKHGIVTRHGVRLSQLSERIRRPRVV